MDTLGHFIVGARVIGRDRGWAYMYFSTQSTEHVDLVRRGFVRYGKDTAVATNGGNHCDTVTCIAGGSLHNHPSWGE